MKNMNSIKKIYLSTFLVNLIILIINLFILFRNPAGTVSSVTILGVIFSAVFSIIILILISAGKFKEQKMSVGLVVSLILLPILQYLTVSMITMLKIYSMVFGS
ncbi:TPA: hypothetical protein DD449_02980 [Candidatus Berkelbacteria bacterium]|uniref:Uncharacterized protein n=1 Tax=Berkelbacteria bacterium GW2011_GWE1_39_12 TaxID=1618337 RepID=A0A0G4B2A9_9BACT|nr:MAG: hypothetical protein UT28_C0001G0173 [Berkelbacteria bacterium GW2011_GWE1_39_12]HBO60622.1 hypothetical protein [Candidatus Berkelbacteria bacterium]